MTLIIAPYLDGIAHKTMDSTILLHSVSRYATALLDGSYLLYLGTLFVVMYGTKSEQAMVLFREFDIPRPKQPLHLGPCSKAQGSVDANEACAEPLHTPQTIFSGPQRRSVNVHIAILVQGNADGVNHDTVLSVWFSCAISCLIFRWWSLSACTKMSLHVDKYQSTSAYVGVI